MAAKERLAGRGESAGTLTRCSIARLDRQTRGGYTSRPRAGLRLHPGVRHGALRRRRCEWEQPHYISWRPAWAGDAEWMFEKSRTRLAPALTEASSWMSDGSRQEHRRNPRPDPPQRWHTSRQASNVSATPSRSRVSRSTRYSTVVLTGDTVRHRLRLAKPGGVNRLAGHPEAFRTTARLP